MHAKALPRNTMLVALKPSHVQLKAMQVKAA
jgi:hypothetical protein